MYFKNKILFNFFNTNIRNFSSIVIINKCHLEPKNNLLKNKKLL